MTMTRAHLQATTPSVSHTSVVGSPSGQLIGVIEKAPRGESKYCFVRTPSGNRYFLHVANYVDKGTRLMNGMLVSFVPAPPPQETKASSVDKQNGKPASPPSGGRKAKGEIATNCTALRAYHPSMVRGTLDNVGVTSSIAFVQGPNGVTHFLHRTQFFGEWPWQNGRRVCYVIEEGTPQKGKQPAALNCIDDPDANSLSTAGSASATGTVSDPNDIHAF